MESNLGKRILSALVLLPPVIAALYWGGWVITLLALIVCALAALEFFSFPVFGHSPLKTKLAVTALLIPGGFVCWGWSGLVGGLLLAVISQFVLHVVTTELEKHETGDGNLLPAGMLGLCYVGLLYSMFVILAGHPNGGRVVGWLLAIVVATDTLAYFGGRTIGGAKLSPRISPNKTISGSICGFVGGLAAGIGAGIYLFPLAGYAELLVFAALASILSQFGDLAESAIKRIYGVKDSSALIPGHGGVLDRLDGLVFALPVGFIITF